MRVQRQTLVRTFVHASQPRARIWKHVMPGNCANYARNAANDPAQLTDVGGAVDGSFLNTRALVNSLCALRRSNTAVCYGKSMACRLGADDL